MRIVVDIQDGVVTGVSSDQALPGVELLIMTDKLENASSEWIGRADGRDVIVYDLPILPSDDRRFWRDVEESRKKASNAYAKAFNEYEGDDVIDGHAVEVVSKDRRLPCA